MTEEQQRIAIAEACGWVADGPDKTFFRQEGVGLPTMSLPDYLHDLNACHEMEKTLRGKTVDEQYLPCVYEDLLSDIVAGGPENLRSTWMSVTATASQRAEAFLRTIGRWNDTTEVPSANLGDISSKLAAKRIAALEAKLSDAATTKLNTTALRDAAILINEIMKNEVNAEDEAEKWLRAYAPDLLRTSFTDSTREHRRKDLACPPFPDQP